jgi:hypothetical protein
MVKRRVDRPPVFEDPGVTYNGTGAQFIDNSTVPGTFYYYGAWSGNRTDGSWSELVSYVQALPKPIGPSNFTVKTIDYNIINLTWVKGHGANTTIIVRKVGGYPENMSDGIEVYNETGSSYSDSYMVGGNISYCYAAWSKSTYIYFDGVANITYAEISNENGSSGNTTGMTTTIIGPPTVLTSNTTNITYYSAILNALLVSNGGEPAICGLYWGNETYFQNISLGLKTNGETYSYNISGLQIGSTYYVQAWSVSIYAFVVGENKTWYTRPSAPTNLIVTTYNDVSQNLSWTTGTNGVDKNVVVGKKGGYPTSPTDGVMIHNGTEEAMDVRYNFSIPPMQIA